jgi:hypothetical protein
MKPRQLAINNPLRLRRIFVCLKSCCVERIAGYVTEVTRLKTDKKASKVGGLFIAVALGGCPRIEAVARESGFESLVSIQ